MTRTLQLAFILLGLSSKVVGQTGIEIKGKVFALQLITQDTLRLKNASVYLEFRDSSRIKQTTDENGEYKFLVKGSNRPMRVYAKANSQTFCKVKSQYCFISDGLYRSIPASHHISFKADFEFKQFTDCGPVPPKLIFKLNSAQAINQKDSVNYLVAIMRDYPLMKIQIQGHADSKEQNPRALSRKRARHVYNDLVKSGIDKSRLSYKSLGDMTPLISEQIITKAPSEDEKLALRQINTRVTFKVEEFGIE